MSRILIIGEHDGRTLNQSTARCVSCAQDIKAAQVDIVLLGADGLDDVARQAAALAGVANVLTAANAANRGALAAVLAPQVAAIAADYDYVLAPSTTFGKDLLPRIAALLGVPQVSDIMKVIGPREFQRPIYAGNAVVTVEPPRSPSAQARRHSPPAGRRAARCPNSRARRR